MRSKMKKIMLATVLGSALATTAHAEGDYLLATASKAGTYYPVGVAIATTTKVKLQPKNNISISAISSAGSAENIKLLRDNEAQFAILQGLYGYYAWKGEGPLKEVGQQENLRSVSMLWQNVEQFVIANDKVQKGDVSDLTTLKGQKMAMGKQNSGTIGSNRVLLSGLGVDIDKDYDLMHAGYGPSADALQNGQVSGVGIPAGTPTGAITKLFASAGDKVTMLNITDEQMKAMDGGKGLWTRFVIKSGTYPNLDKDVNVIAQPNFLAVNKDVSEEDVYMITKTLYENLPLLNNIHKATKAMSIDKAIAGLVVPLHPGAAKYYKEQGIDIPEHLIAK